MLGLEVWLARHGFMGPLISRAKESDRRVRLAAVTALGGLPKPKVVEPLCRALDDESDEVRETAAKALGGRGAEIAIEPLKKSLGDKEPKVRKAAMLALITYERPVSLWGCAWLAGEGGPRQKTEARETLLAAAGDAILPLRTALTDGAWQVRSAATEIMAALKDPRVEEQLGAVLQTDPDADVRKAAAVALGDLLGPNAPDALLAALNNTQEDVAVRSAAAKSLTRYGAEKGLLAWIWMLAIGDDAQKTTGHRVVADAGLAAFDPLCAALKDGYWTVRRAAAGALVEMKDPRAVLPLCNALSDGDWQVRLSAAEALAQIADRTSFVPLKRTLTDPISGVRAAAALALGRLRAIESVEALTPMLTDPDYEVRAATIRALGSLKSTRTIESLIAAVKDESDIVRHAAADALGDLGGAAAVDALCAALKDLNDRVRVAAAAALGKLRSRAAFRPLAEALNDWYSIVGHSAARALLEIGPPPSLWGHAWLLGSGDEGEKAGAKAAIREAGAAAVDALSAALKIWQVEIRCAAAQALGEIDDPRIVAPLVVEGTRPPLNDAVLKAAFQALFNAKQPATGVQLAKAIDATIFMPDDKPLIERMLEYVRTLVQSSPWLTKQDREALAAVYKKLRTPPPRPAE
jgi:HEAT repeat protein